MREVIQRYSELIHKLRTDINEVTIKNHNATSHPFLMDTWRSLKSAFGMSAHVQQSQDSTLYTHRIRLIRFFF